MLAEQRRQKMLDRLAISSSARTEELASTFDVSIETVRRDFQALEKQGLIRRVHGGAVLVGRSQIEAPYSDRALTRAIEKRELAQEAVRLLPEGGTIFLDLGTTIAAVADAIPQPLSATIITTSVYIASILAHHDNLEVIVAGGKMRHGDLSLSGAHTMRFLEGIYPDVALISTGAVDAQAGITDFNMDELGLKQLVLRNSRSCFAVADSSKFSHVAPFRICTIAEPNLIITDSGLSNREKDKIQAAGGTLLLPGRTL